MLSTLKLFTAFFMSCNYDYDVTMSHHTLLSKSKIKKKNISISLTFITLILITL